MTNTELARKLRECADGVFNSNSMYYVDVMRQAADELDRRATIQPTAATVGEIVLFGGTLKEVAWAKGKMPAPGTKLYAAPVAPADAVRDAERYRWLRDKSEPGICAFYLSVGQAFKNVKFARETVDEAIDAQIDALRSTNPKEPAK